jgi:hypothetical protein
MTDPRYEPYTQEQVRQLLVNIGASEEVLASFRDHPDEMTEVINRVRTSPLDMATKRTLIAALDDDGSD